ncbi:cupin domain-containing protein [Gluconacetobacter asukensis]|uniref:Cupin domain-containing protein n=1 Tax=Gluconacetobacter asukensis TaxID=1017181 RepID=A0A7W4J2L7_9PROT|nr:cupin domain-containing protein [Gluconacetobacter asukensis]MBB2173434.1 cupin domain-containing protein [Gluconacetobacter asukensis]
MKDNAPFRNIIIPDEILELLPSQGSVELQRDVPHKVHDFHTHPVDEVLFVIQGALVFTIDDEPRTVGPGDRVFLPAGTNHKSEALDQGAIYVIAAQ